MDKDTESKGGMKSHSFEAKKSSAVESYTVKAGDTLSMIAKKFYGDEKLYTKIYEANKGLIGGSPDDIKVGQELKIPPK